MSRTEKGEIEDLVQQAILLKEVSTQSIIFPAIITPEDFRNFLLVLKDTSPFFLEQEVKFRGMICLGYRVRVGKAVSWVTGFGGFDFLPKTRQAVFTEIVFRSKPRPRYKKVMKEAPPGVIHLADMRMHGMTENKFQSLWYGSFDNTERVIGHKPDLRSAAKTTFAVPASMWK